MKEKQDNGRGQITIIALGTNIDGSVEVANDIRVEGSIKGKLRTKGILTVSKTGVVEAEIEAKSAVIGGKVIGNLIANERVELAQNASLVGDLKTKDLAICEGAIFQGNCSMHSEKDDLKTEK